MVDGATLDKTVAPGGTDALCEDDWTVVDYELRRNAAARAELDARELHWLRAAERVRIWKHLGMVSMLDYMDRALGYPPETARKRLRVARALGELPQLTAALASGALTFSAVRELARVATPGTEAAWRDAALGKSSREIEELVSGHRPGDLPGDPPDDDARTHVVTFEITGATFALLRQARLALDEQRGGRLEDDDVVAELARAVLDHVPAGNESADGAAEGAARYQIALTVCKRCDRGWQTGAGASIAVDAATVERARCDAIHIGSIDGDAPERARQAIPPSVRRFVWARDRGRCQTPGCRSARGLEVHHIVHVEHGGTNEAPNLTLRCGACHDAHHRGLLTITGCAPDQIVTVRNVRPAVVHHRPAAPGLSSDADARLRSATVAEDQSRPAFSSNPRSEQPSASSGAGPPTGTTRPTPSKLAASIRRSQARDALVALGWKPRLAAEAVADALGHVAHDTSLEELIREALRRLHKTSSGMRHADMRRRYALEGSRCASFGAHISRTT